MKTEYLKSFTAVVESKSFSAAAKRLFLSQPAISTHIKQLEEELCVQLLTRSTKDVQLTEAGLLFYPYALRILETEREAFFSLHGKEGGLKGTVQIAASTVPANYLLADFISYMSSRYPEISYRINEGDSTEVFQEVMHFDAEIGVCGFQTKNPKCIYDELFTDEIVLVTPNTPYFAAFGKEKHGGTPMYFDTHAHYDDAQFDPDRDALLSALPAAGVTLVVNPGSDMASSRAVLALSER